MQVQEVADADDLYRRIHFSQVKDGGPTSAAFKHTELSVDLAKLTTPQQSLSGHPSHGLVSITAGHARSLGQEVVHSPLDVNLAHALVIGNKTLGIARNLARTATWVLLPPE
jgi:hypothetical protein